MTDTPMGERVSAPSPMPKATGKHPEDHRKGRHQDRPEPDRSGLEDRLPPGDPPFPQDVRVIDEQDRVLLHQPHQEDEADES